MLGISQSAFAVGIVVLLFGVFVLLLLGSFARARRAAKALAAAGEAGAPPATGRPGVAATTAPKGRKLVSRRDFFRGGLLGSLLVFAAQFGGASLAFLWPSLRGGFGSLISLSDTPDSILQQIKSTRQPFYFGAGRFYLINYTGDGDKPGGIYEGITADGLMALYQKCAHLGCRVPFCEQSQWFECPCHGSKYNYAGEYELGPAPMGLSRFKVSISGGRVSVDTSPSGLVTGPPRGTDTIHEPPQGPFCV